MLIIALFGFFHGYAHGLVMLGTIEAEAYVLDFIATTVALHLAGIVVGIATRAHFVHLLQTLGAIIGAICLYILSNG